MNKEKQALRGCIGAPESEALCSVLPDIEGQLREQVGVHFFA